MDADNGKGNAVPKIEGGNSTSPDAASIGQAISNQQTGEKPKRKYVRSGLYSKNAGPQNSGIENPPSPEKSGFGDISESDRILYQECFGQSVEEGLTAISNVMCEHATNRLRKIEIPESDCVQIGESLGIKPATARALNKQAVILARKYDLLSRFGVEAVVMIELATWGVQMTSAMKRIGELERNYHAAKKVKAETPA